MSEHGLTIEKMGAAREMMERHSVPVTPEAARAFITAAYEVGLLDYWEAWRRLYNAGARNIKLKTR